MPKYLNLAIGAVAALAFVVGGCSSDDDFVVGHLDHDRAPR